MNRRDSLPAANGGLRADEGVEGKCCVARTGPRDAGAGRLFVRRSAFLPIPDCRNAAEGRHIILFRVDDDALQIVRVLHSSMDFKRHIRPESE